MCPVAMLLTVNACVLRVIKCLLMHLNSTELIFICKQSIYFIKNLPNMNSCSLIVIMYSKYSSFSISFFKPFHLDAMTYGCVISSKIHKMNFKFGMQ